MSLDDLMSMEFMDFSNTNYFGEEQESKLYVKDVVDEFFGQGSPTAGTVPANAPQPSTEEMSLAAAFQETSTADTPAFASPFFGPGGANHQESMMANDHFQNRQRMQLRAYYKDIAIRLTNRSDLLVDGESARHDINNPTGFVIYHNQIRPGLPESVLPFQLPSEKPWMVDRLGPKDTRLTMDICKDTGGGLHVECDDGCIYATRYCASHVFFWANDNNEAQTVDVKLERKQRTLVFDIHAFYARIANLAGNREAIMKERLPVVVFSFGIPWKRGSSNLRETLIHVEVTPMSAVKRLLSQTAGQDDIKSIPKSINMDDIQKSNDPFSN